MQNNPADALVAPSAVPNAGEGLKISLGSIVLPAELFNQGGEIQNTQHGGPYRQGGAKGSLRSILWTIDAKTLLETEVESADPIGIAVQTTMGIKTEDPEGENVERTHYHIDSIYRSGEEPQREMYKCESEGGQSDGKKYWYHDAVFEEAVPRLLSEVDKSVNFIDPDLNFTRSSNEFTGYKQSHCA